MAAHIVSGLHRHMHLTTRGSLPRKSLITRTLKLEGDRILALKASWDPAPFSGKWTEDWDLYARRAAAGYLSSKRSIFARWLYGEVAPSVERSARAVFESARTMMFQSARASARAVFGVARAVFEIACAVLKAAPKIIAKAPWRFFDVPLGAFVNVFIVCRRPLVSAAYTCLTACFCSRQSFLFYVSIVTAGICAITASLPLVGGLAFPALKLLVALCIAHRWPLVAAVYTGLIYVSILTAGICFVTTNTVSLTGVAFFVFKAVAALLVLIRLVVFTVFAAE